MNVYRSSLEFSPNETPSQRAAVLPLLGCGLLVDACGGYARVRLSQRFENPHDEPLSVTYKLPLPADAAVSDFAFHVGEKIMRGKVKARSEARQDYERALVEGRSAALLEQDRTNLFTQEIGNIPPKSTVVVEIDIDQPLAWLNEGYWEWRFPLTTAPRYLGSHLSQADEQRLSLQIAKGDTGVRASLEMTVRDNIANGRSPESPSHPLACAASASGFKVELGSGNRAELDRDVVVRWNATLPEPGLSLDVARIAGPMGENMFGLLTIVPPSPEGRPQSIARDLTLLLDTSGSMSGEPLAQAKRMACALVDSLAETDLLEVIEFSNQARNFRPSAQAATPRLKQEATAWIQGLQAQGGTEMVSGVERAMRELRPGSQRQIILITDGLVGFEEDIVTTVLARLPITARLHCVGVGSAVNRSLVAPIARAGRGVEAIVGLGEDAERAAKRVLAGTVRPLLVDVVLEGSALRSVMPSRLPDVFEGCPLRAAIEIASTGGRLRLRARMNGTAFIREIQVDPIEAGSGNAAIMKLFGRELVEDLEMRLSSGENKRTIEGEIERVGVAFQISTRLTSWIAETVERTVDPRDPSRHTTQPNALAYGLSAEGLGLREANLVTGTYAAAEAAPAKDARAFAPPLMQQPMPMSSMPPSAGAFAPPPPPSFAPQQQQQQQYYGGAPPQGMGMGAPPPPAGAPQQQGFGPPPPPQPAAPAPEASERMGVGGQRRNVAAPPSPSRSAPQPPAEKKSERSRERMEAEDLDDEAVEDRAYAPQPRKAAEAAAPSQARSPVFGQARITFVSGAVVTIELFFGIVPPGVMLRHGDIVATLVLSNGQEVVLRVWGEQSSREGALMPNLVYRLALAAPFALQRETITVVRVAFGGVAAEAR